MNGAVLYRDSERMAIVTGLRRPSKNPKTGPMLQTWILATGTDPVTATQTGADSAVCGDCDGRRVNSGWCYVTAAHAPLQAFKTYSGQPVQTGALDTIDASIRLGAYGDPATVPIEQIDRWVHRRRHTGYTHQWRTCSGEYSAYVMASCETPEHRTQAKDQGYRTFRVVPSASHIAPDEVHCPADKQPGRHTCATCGLCDGMQTSAKDVAVVAHGGGGQPQKLLQIEGYGQ